MTEKKDRHEEQRDKEDNFTGSPEQQLPDLEGEDRKSHQKEQDENEAGSDEKEDK